jgi:hypothetical protein
LLVSGCGRRVGGRPRGSAADGGLVPRRHWKERAMILIGLVIIVIAVLMMVVVPRIRRKL